MSSEVTDSVQEARARLLNHFNAHQSDPSAGWSALWDEGEFLPWDKGFPNPALDDVLKHRQDLIGSSTEGTGGVGPRRKTALVPGCGKGVDVLLLASYGYNATGLEVSKSAVKAAEEFRKQHEHDDSYKVKDDKVGMGQVKFIYGDFFKDDWLESQGQTFDLIYDYTVSIPTAATSWNIYRTWNARLTAHSSYLLCHHHFDQRGLHPSPVFSVLLQ